MVAFSGFLGERLGREGQPAAATSPPTIEARPEAGELVGLRSTNTGMPPYLHG
jgi:hypothetical protein